MSPPLPPQRRASLGPDALGSLERVGACPDPTATEQAPDPAHDFLVVADPSGRLLAVSPPTERILGVPADPGGPGHLLDRLHPEDRERVEERLVRLLPGGGLSRLHCRLRHADGRWISVRWWLCAPAWGSRIDRVAGEGGVEAASRSAEVRLETAQELHDGVLQTLTATTLQLEVARRLVRVDPSAAEEVLATLRESVSAEQRELRLYVEELRLEESLGGADRAPLSHRIGEMLERIRGIWNVRIVLSIDQDGRLGAEAERRVFRIIQEAVVNAVRHGRAERIEVRVVHEDGTMRIQVVDDGRGFPFTGDFEFEELKDKRLGPLSLKRRVMEAGGRLSIRSTLHGATVRIALPLVDPLPEVAR